MPIDAGINRERSIKEREKKEKGRRRSPMYREIDADINIER